MLILPFKFDEKNKHKENSKKYINNDFEVIYINSLVENAKLLKEQEKAININKEKNNEISNNKVEENKNHKMKKKKI